MSNILCVSNRKLCCDDFLDRIEKIAKANTNGIILREKDLDESNYYELAQNVLTICNKYNQRLIIHYYPNVAKKLGVKSIHLPLYILEKLSLEDRQYFDTIGASCHSIDDVKKAKALGCTYAFAGHIFETDCKKGLKGRGLDFLSEVCKSSDIPIYAIGGMNSDNYRAVIDCGAKGVAIMSGLMMCDEPSDYINDFED